MKRTFSMTITLGVALSTGIAFSSPAAARTSLADLQEQINQLNQRVTNFEGVCPSSSSTRYADNGDDTICDRDTGLMWEQKNAEDGVANLDNPRDVDNIYTWTTTADGDDTNADGTAFTDFLPRLNGVTPSSEQLGGYNDWRIPTIDELETIVDCSFGWPCIDPIFGPTAAAIYWSSTSAAYAPNRAWYVDFFDGGVGGNFKTFGVHVRAVRGGR